MAVNLALKCTQKYILHVITLALMQVRKALEYGVAGAFKKVVFCQPSLAAVECC